MICQRLVEDGVISRNTEDMEEPMNPSVKIDPITHQPIVSNSAIVRASIRTSKSLVEPGIDEETPETTISETKAKIVTVIEKCLNVLRLIGSHYVYRGVLVLLQAIDALLLLLAVLGFYFNYRLTLG